ncbi:Jacalin-like lectin domain-containing protein [Syntrophus gentianae]|uniref:Jacalin-like lectin domain-containing protein n=1 Tax=Syntrophus gentianae TaxID=43775 RepID=A0A1H7U7J5_9BACT|nr:jacalin-like lectin [Syntrophus gentianae]SEL92598.1 Jacalin-like lectin domain-containing protein [Syntrophus gentianae]
MGSDPDAKGGKSHRTEIIVALITLAGVLGGALLANWDKVFPPTKPEPAPIAGPAAISPSSPSVPQQPAEPTRSDQEQNTSHKAIDKKQKPETRIPWYQISTPTHKGTIHTGCNPFNDRSDVYTKEPISRIEVYHGRYIYGICISYGTVRGGNHGLTQEGKYGIHMNYWEIQNDEKITRVEGNIEGNYLSGLKFFTDRGRESPKFGQGHGTSFKEEAPANGSLRTISGWANLDRNKGNRAICGMTFHFGKP